jgi:ABC-type Fe3+ transport system substrate-binding protein
LPATVQRLIIPNPGQWDIGTMLVVALLDRARTVGGGTERGWELWEQLRGRLELAHALTDFRTALEGPEGSVALLPRHLAIQLGSEVANTWLLWPDEVPALPNYASAVSLAACPDQATQFLAWLRSPAAHSILLDAGRLPIGCPAEHAQCGAARDVEQRTMALNIAWGFDNYNRIRTLWQSRFGAPASGA